MRLWVRILLLLAGVAVLGVLATTADWPAIGEVFGRLGWLAPVGLLPYLAVYAIDTVAWSLTLPAAGRPPFLRLFRLRWAGEAVNNLIPTGYIGGEAVKVYLLNHHGMAVGDGAAGAVLSKTAQTLAQVVFIAIGAALFARMPDIDGSLRIAMLALAATGFVGVAGFILLQQRGLSEFLLGVVDRCRLRISWIDRRRAQFLAVDHQVRAFYTRQRGQFHLSTACFFLGWLIDSVEILLVGRLMGIPITATEALAIEAFIGVAKVLGLVVPGAIGVQESGVIMLCRLAGLPGPFGYAYALWRRFRELLYAGIGWALLTAVRGPRPSVPPPPSSPHPGIPPAQG